MIKLKDISLKGKTRIMILVNASFILLIGLVGFFVIGSLRGAKDELIDNSQIIQNQLVVGRMADNINSDIYRSIFMDKTNPMEMSEFVKDFNTHHKTMEKAFKTLKDLAIKNDEEKTIKKLEKPYKEYAELSQKIKDLTVKNDFEAMMLVMPFKESYKKINLETKALEKYFSKKSNGTEVSFSSLAMNSQLIIVGVVLVAFLFSIIFISYIMRFINKAIGKFSVVLADISKGILPEFSHNYGKDEIGSMAGSLAVMIEGLQKTSSFAHEIGQNNVNAEFEPLSEEDVLGNSLLDMRANLLKVAQDERKRNWATEGLAKFAEILRNNNEGISILGDNIISNLVRYLDANQGGLFVVNDHNENDKYLELIACYAWNKKKFINMRVDEGEGLVGQAWQENDTLYITDVPQNYVRITSGLGDANPKSFLIVPLTVNDETFGVIEIASFKDIEQYQIDFVNKLAESIASTLSTAKTNERTKILLEQSQQQAEEMRAQEEEMRQNMEEMAATQEEMQRKEMQMTEMLEQMRSQEEEMRQNMEEMEATQEQMEYQGRTIAEKAAESQGILDGINATMATIEFSPDGYVKDANANFLHTMKTTLAQIHGKHHSNFVPNDVKNTAEYKSFWTDLANGIAKEGVFKRQNAFGEIVWLNAIYNPIRNAEGEVVKVIKFANDITVQKEQEADLTAKMSGVNATMATIEFTPQGIVLDANANFLSTMKCTLEDIKGKHHSNFVKPEYANSTEYKSFWTDLEAGKANKGIFERINAKGEVVWLNAIYNPIRNANGEVIKVIKFASDITEQKVKELEVQQLLEESRSQEEEIRQNMEEMQAIQEETERLATIQREKDAVTKKLYEGEINSMYEKWYAQLKRLEQQQTKK